MSETNLAEYARHWQEEWRRLFQEWRVKGADLRVKHDTWSDHQWADFLGLSDELLSMATHALPGRDYTPLAELIEAVRLRLPTPKIIVHYHLATTLIGEAVDVLAESLLAHAAKPATEDKSNGPTIPDLIDRGFERMTVDKMKKEWDMSSDPLGEMAERAVEGRKIHADYEHHRPRESNRSFGQAPDLIVGFRRRTSVFVGIISQLFDHLSIGSIRPVGSERTPFDSLPRQA